MPEIIDASYPIGGYASALASAGVKTVIRYYSRDTIHPSKRLTRAEAGSLTAAGLRIAIVHEGRFGDIPTNYDKACGLADGAYARTYGAEVIGQPGGSAIYFGIDFDATATQITDRIGPYFQGLHEAFSANTGEPVYRIGAYGSGRTCKALMDAGLVELAWLAQSTGWSGYQPFLNSGRWALRQDMPAKVAGVDCDPDVAGAVGEFGAFSLAPAAPGAGTSGAMFVMARSGLKLRAGPGTEFDRLKLLPFGAAVHPLQSIGSWTMIDLQGDGAADGFVSSAYLADKTPGSAVVAAPVGGGALVIGTSSGDAAHVPQLIANGTSAAGLRAAREAAKQAWPDYPHNGCAAHLSALLRASGIGVAMILGAGKLAYTLEQRGWAKIHVGGQVPGDVGVTFDNDPSIPGADHIYLVVGTNGPDEMLIADNQRSTDEPHTRFASGRGKTPTDYFLRAV